MSSLSGGGDDTSRSTQVWDLFVRVFHWGLVGAFGAAYVLSDDGGTLHHALGYAVLGLVAARIVWGFVGTYHARFANFVPTPRAFTEYARAILAGRERRYLGHNPAGGAMIMALLMLLTATGVTGWLLTTNAFWGSEALETLHGACANAVLVCVVLHVGGVLLASWRHRENLVSAMLTGRKRND
jgi:cytochrome b